VARPSASGESKSYFVRTFSFTSASLIKPQYACKVIREQDGVTPQDIDNELRAIRRICTTAHKNIVQVYVDWREVMNGVRCCFIVMELCSHNFEEHLNRCRQENTIWDWWFFRGKGLFSMELEVDMLSGLVFIHAMNEIHRDLKPANGTLPSDTFLFFGYY